MTVYAKMQLSVQICAKMQQNYCTIKKSMLLLNGNGPLAQLVRASGS